MLPHDLSLISLKNRITIEIGYFLLFMFWPWMNQALDITDINVIFLLFKEIQLQIYLYLQSRRGT